MNKNCFVVLLLLMTLNFYSQQLKYKSVDYYLENLKKIETIKLQEKGLLDQNLNITSKFRKNGKNKLNNAGLDLYIEVKTNLLKSYFKDYLYQQHLEYKGETYVLYFSMAGFDDLEWCILKWKKGKWKNSEKIDKKIVKDSKRNKNNDFDFICFNYDEGPKNRRDVKILIKDHYLIMQRSGLDHSLFDMKSQKLLLNEECPWCQGDFRNKEEMNVWIKKNLHERINSIIKD